MFQKFVLMMGMILFWASPVAAHVKWFSEFSFADQPLSLDQVLSPLFWIMMGLSGVVISALVILDKKLKGTPKLQGFIQKAETYKKHSLTIMRAASAAVLLLSFQADALFVPELKISSGFVGWLQFIFAVMLLFPQTVSFSGLGILGLFAYGVSKFGMFHMLDYILFAGVGYYLVVSSATSEKLKESGLIAMYATVGLSLCWVAIEKLLFPQWSFYILEQNPQLALGLNFTFFLTAAAFVEFSLGYLMIICLLQRPLALVVTLVFFMTTLVFGKMEVIGHTLIHAALIVFLIEGSGRFFKAPIHFHNRLRLKIPFAAVNFIILLFVLLIPYQKIAMARHLQFVQMRNALAGVDTTHWSHPPEIKITLTKDSGAGWNVHVRTQNFRFAPEHAGDKHVDGEGHAHLYIDNKKASRVYGDWYYLSHLSAGKHTIKVTLNTNDHRVYVFNEQTVEDQVVVEVERDMPSMDH